jgi:hypothetical protein
MLVEANSASKNMDRTREGTLEELGSGGITVEQGQA